MHHLYGSVALLEVIFFYRHCISSLIQVAAQNCRKRKIDQIAQLERQVEEARQRKQQLREEREHLYQQREEWAQKLSLLENDILSGLSKDPTEFSLDLSSAEVRIVTRRQPVGGGATAAVGQVRSWCNTSVMALTLLRRHVTSVRDSGTSQRSFKFCTLRVACNG